MASLSVSSLSASPSMIPCSAIPHARDLLWWALFGAGVVYTWIDRMAHHGLMWIADREHMKAATELALCMHVLGFCRKRCRLLIAINLHDVAT